jgi:hypothetical protein
VLAASFEVEHPPGTIAAHNPPNRLEGLLTEPQRRFLSDCADIRINIDALTVLLPIAATRWRAQSTSPNPEFDIVAERWTVAAAMTFLEFSIRVPAADAGPAKQAFEQLLQARGLRVEAMQETKTKRVLKHLVSQVAE